VGEAQKEPNENPKLEKPTEGRGFGDMLVGTPLDFGKFSLPNLGLLRNLLIMAGGLISLIGVVVVMKFM
jgi:hypothetical protein